MRQFVLVALVLAGVVCPAHLEANTWCSTAVPDAVFCEDFDRYCTNPPPWPQACPSGSTIDGNLFNSQWAPTGPCSSPMGLDTAYAVSPPWGAKTNTQENSTLALTRRSFSDLVRAKFGDPYSSVMATDLNPLVLEVVMQANRPRYDNSYLSLGTGFATAPTDFAWSDFCGCTSNDPRYPIICAQDSSPGQCPPANTWPHVSCIAVGFVAYLDPEPCHCSESSHSPYNDHLSFYDGRQWYRLRSGLFPSSAGDFRLRSGQHRIRITLKLSTVKVELTTPNTGEYSWCELPRDYAGPFSSVTLGYAVPCLLKSSVWECRGDPSDPACGDGAPGGSVPYYDNLALSGGIGYEAPGACCFSDTTCEDQQWGGDCRTLGGTFAGSGTACDSTACCPPLLADHDMDNDVDLEDFGWFQTCLSPAPFDPPPTLACTCADLDHDGDVDVTDFVIFTNCLSGAGQSPPEGCLQ